MCASKSYACLLLASILVLGPAWAAEKKADPGKEQVKRLQQAQRKLEQEKNELLAQKTAVEGELGEIRKKVEGEARRAASLGREVVALRLARDELAVKQQATDGELRKTQEALRAAEGENRRLQAGLSEEKQQRLACIEEGKALRKVGNDVLRLYEQKSCLDSTLQREPFTGLKRIEIENAVEDLRDRLEAPGAGS